MRFCICTHMHKQSYMSLNLRQGAASPCCSSYRSDVVKGLLIHQQIFFQSWQLILTFAMTDTSQMAPQMAASTERSQIVATLISDSFAAPPCVPCTHTTLAVIQMLKNLPLISILQMNKEIEEKNAERSRKTFNHTCDPTVYTESGSEEASLISLDNMDLNQAFLWGNPQTLSDYTIISYSFLEQQHIHLRFSFRAQLTDVQNDPTLQLFGVADWQGDHFTSLNLV